MPEHVGAKIKIVENIGVEGLGEIAEIGVGAKIKSVAREKTAQGEPVPFTDLPGQGRVQIVKTAGHVE